ncbi:MAG: hypothetical protein KAU58_05735, partial [Candidatus Omnitrophica bacterium]|nr:hypothetical protein [Candidatus Omnitrophota bacterium]
KWIYTNTDVTGDDNQTAWVDDVMVSGYIDDNFSQAPEVSFVSRDDGGNWEVMDDGTDNYVYRQTGGGTHITIMDNSTISDGSIEAKLKLHSPPVNSIGNSAWICFRMDENGNGYAVQVRQDENRLYTWMFGAQSETRAEVDLYLYTVANYALRTQLGKVRCKYSSFNGWRSFAIKVELEGESIKVYLDNTLRISQKHSAYTSGGIAIGTKVVTHGAYFDDISVIRELVSNNFTPIGYNGNWQVVDDGTGNYVYEQSIVNDTAYHIGIINGETIGDGTIETKFKLQYGSDDRALVYFRMDENGNGYAAQVKRDNNNGYLYLYTADKYSLSGQIASSLTFPNLFYNDGNKWHTLRIELEKDSIKVYLDTQASHISQKHSAYISGSIAIGTYVLSNPAYFDDIAITYRPVINDFSQVLEAPFTLRDDGGNWQVVDDGTGNYVYRQSATDDSTHIAIIDGETIKDGVIEAKFRLQTSVSRAQVYFRLDENGNGYVAHVKRYDNDCHFSLRTVGSYSVENGRCIKVLAFSDFFSGSDEWHTLKVEVKGNSIKMYLDNRTEHIDQINSSYISGNVAIGTYALNSAAYFDDIVITHIPINNDFTRVIEAPFTPRDDGGSWQVVDDGTGNYVYEQSMLYDNAFHMTIMDSLQFREGTIETKFKLRYAPGECFFILLGLDKKDYSFALQFTRDYNDFYVSLCFYLGNGEIMPVKTLRTFKNVFISSDEWHTVRVELKDSSIKVYLDDMRFYYVELLFKNLWGNVGLATYYLDYPAQFDDIYIEGGFQYYNLEPLTTGKDAALPNGFISDNAFIQNKINSAWHTDNIQVRLPRSEISGRLSGVDATNNTFKLVDLTVNVDPLAYLYLDNRPINLALLKEELTKVQNIGIDIVLNTKKIDMDLSGNLLVRAHEKCYFVTKDSPSSVLQPGSILEAVDAIDGTLTFGGQTIIIPKTYESMKWYGVTISLLELQYKLTAAELDGDKVVIVTTAPMHMTKAGWAFKAGNFDFRLLNMNSTSVIVQGSYIDSVDAVNGTMNIGGVIISVKDITNICWYTRGIAEVIDITELENRLVQAQAAGKKIEIYSNTGIIKTETGWLSTSAISVTQTGIAINLKTGSIVDSINIDNQTITIGGQIIKIRDGTNITWITSEGSKSIDLTGLAEKLNEAATGGEKVEIANNENVWIDDSDWEFGTVNLEFKITKSKFTLNYGALLNSIDISGRTITIGGLVMGLPDNIIIEWYMGPEYPSNITIKGLETRLNQAHIDEYKVELSSSIRVQAFASGLKLMENTLKFHIEGGSMKIDQKSVLENVDVDNQTITIGGQIIGMHEDRKDNIIHFRTGDEYETMHSLLELKNRLDETHLSGNEIQLTCDLGVKLYDSGWRSTVHYYHFNVIEYTFLIDSDLSIVDSVDIVNQTMTVGGQVIKLQPPGTFEITWYGVNNNSDSICFNDPGFLKSKIEDAQNLGYNVVFYSGPKVRPTDSGWEFAKGDMCLKILCGRSSLSYGSIIDSIDLSNKTMTVGGQTIKALSEDGGVYFYTNTWSSSRETITFEELADKIDQANASGQKITLASSIPIFCTGTHGGNEWFAQTDWLYIRVAGPVHRLNEGALLHSVDILNNTMTIGSNVIKISDSTCIKAVSPTTGEYETLANLAELKSRLDEVHNNGSVMELYLDAYIAETDTGWKLDQKYIHLVPKAGQPLYFGLEPGSIVQNVNTVDNTITIGGQVIEKPAAYDLIWYENYTEQEMS